MEETLAQGLLGAALGAIGSLAVSIGFCIKHIGAATNGLMERLVECEEHRDEDAETIGQQNEELRRQGAEIAKLRSEVASLRKALDDCCGAKPIHPPRDPAA